MEETNKVSDKRFWSKEVMEISRMLDTDLEKGLTTKEANARRETYGFNELPEVKKSFYKLYLAPFFENTIVIIYLISAAIMVLLNALAGSNEWSPYVNFLIVIFNAVTAIVQQVRAQKSLNALRRMSKEECTVIRDGYKTTIEARYLVPGDILDLQEGAKVPADARVFVANNLFTNESSITGESLPVQKTCVTLEDSFLDMHNQRNILFKGTFVTKGNGAAIVFHIAENTEIGKISRDLEEISNPDVPLTKKINHFANILGLIVVLMFVINVIYKFSTVVMGSSKEVLKELALSVDLALKFIPINIVLLSTIILITGVLAIANKGAIVRNLTSIESLGRASVVCTDKTGTLTQNAMTVQYVWTNDKLFNVTGTGYAKSGEILLDGKVISPDEYQCLKNLVISGLMNNNAEIVEESFKIVDGLRNKDKIVRKVIGDPMEAALDVLAEKLRIVEGELKESLTFLKEYPFDSEIKRMTKVWSWKESKDGESIVGNKSGRGWIAFTKGASEIILEKSTNIMADGGKLKSLDSIERVKIKKLIEEWALKGYRTLGIASKELTSLPQGQEYSRDDVESGLNFIGFVVIQDPPREGVRDAVDECENAGVKVVMITGDSPATGTAIAKELGIYHEGKAVYTGGDIDKIPQEEFDNIAVFARVSPSDKTVIVKRYQEEKKVVAMTGDGVNDALALGMADVGLAMGISGTDVAKEAADMIISDDSFNTIEVGIREGRGLFAKIRVMMYFFVYTNLTEAIILFATSFINGFNMFDRAWQIQLIYILPHSLPSLGLTFDRTSNDIMKEKPRDAEEIFNKNVMYLMILNIACLAVALLIATVPILAAFNPSASAELNNENMARPRTIALAVIFMIEVLAAFSVRRPNIPFHKSFRRDMSPLFLFFSTATIAGLIVLVYLPTSIGDPLWLAPLNGIDWVIVLSLSLPALVVLELFKWLKRRRGDHF
ncbi:MAG: cation-translocating P-type ATPase [Promethearchaeota archaeon]